MNSRHPEKNLVFMGRVAASYSHEIKNILAIINESCGLMHDLLTLKKDTMAEHSERFIRTLEDVAQQVQRGHELSTCLNRLAHTPDKEVTGVDLAQQVQTILALCGRLVRNKKLQASLQNPQDKVQITTRPVECMRCIFSALEWAMSCCEAGDEIVFRLESSAEGARIGVAGWSRQAQTQGDDLWGPLQEAVAAVQGTCAAEENELVITLPGEI